MNSDELKQKVRSYRQQNGEETEWKRHKTSDELKEEVRQKRFQEDVRNVDQDYLDLFTKSANDFFSSAQVDIGWDNASSVYQKSQRTLKDLDYRRSVISSWLASNKDSLEADSYKSLSGAMELFSSDSSKVMAALTEAKDYYDKDKNQDAYLAYVDHQNKMNYDLSAGQKKIDDLNRAISLGKYIQAIGHDVRTDMTSEYEALLKTYGWTDNDDLKELLTAETAMYNQSKWTQKEAELASVVDSPDFIKYSQMGAGMQNPSYEDANGHGYIFGWRPGADPVQNKVTFARDNAEALLEERTKGNGNVSTPTIVDPIYRHMTDDEVSIYNYYLAKEGEAKAQEYLDSIQDTLNRREAGEEFGRIQGNTALEVMYGATVGVDQFKSGMSGLVSSFKGEDDYIAPSPIQYAGQAARQDLEDNGPTIFGSSLGQIGYDALSTTANMAPSILASIAVGAVSKTAGTVVSNALLGGSAAGNAYQEKLNLGYSKEQARSYGLMVGASEIVMEKLLGGITALGGGTLSKMALSNLDKVDNILARVAKSTGGKILMNAGSEALEEGLQSILEPYIWQAVSGEDASVDWQEALYSSLLGFVTGGVFEGANASFETVALNNETKQKYGAVQGEVVSEALEIDPDSNFAQRMQSRLDNGKDLSGGQINKLLKNSESGLVKNDIASIQKAAEDTLVKYGETGDVKAISAALAKQASGESLSRAEQRTISESKYGQRVANELNPENIQSGDFNTAWAESLDTNRINVAEYSRLVQDAEATVSSEVSEAGSEVADNAVASTEVEALQNKIEYLKEVAKNPTLSMGQKIDVAERIEAAEQELKAVESGESTQNAPKKVKVSPVVSAPSVSIEEASKKYGKQAKAMVATYNQGQDVAKFDRAYGIAYEMGKSDVGVHYAINSEATSYLTQAQRELAYVQGSFAGKSVAKGLDAKYKTNGTGNSGRRKGAVKLEGIKASEFRKMLKDSNDPRGKAAKVLMTIAEVTGIDIVLFKSELDASGRYVGEQGKFVWKDDTIYIDLNAGLSYGSDAGELTKYAMLRTFGHEFTHFMEKNAATQYTEFRKLVFAEMTKKGENVDYLVKRKQLQYKDEKLSYEAASREVVADAMGDILRDSKFVENLAQKHNGLFKTLLDQFKRFIRNIRSYFNSLADNPSPEAKALKEEINGTMKYLDSIVEMFDKVAMEAVENYQQRVAGNETTVAEVSEQIDSDIAEAMGPDGIALQTPDGSVAVVAKPSENGIDSVIVDSGAWDTQKSIRTYNEDILTDEDGKSISGKDLFRNLMKENGFSDTDIDSAVNRMDSVIDVLTNDFATFGKLQNNLKKGITTNILNNRQRVLFAMISNGDYPINGELSTTCVNRQAFQNMFEKLVESGIMKDVVFNSAAIADMNAILRDHGYLTACFSCFVEARRVRVQKWAENFVSKWNEVAKKHGAKEQFGFFKNRENAEAMAKGDIFDIEEQLSQVGKNDQGNVALPQGNVKKKIDALLTKVPSLAKLITVEDVMSVGGLNAMRRYGEGGQNVFALLRSSYGTASPKISQDFEAYGGDFAKMSFEYINDTLGKSISGSQELVRKIATQKTEAAFEGKSYTKKAYSEEYSKNLNSAATKREALREYLYSIAGIRYQSFSDFDITQVFDKMQIFNDIAANRAPLHEYTKVIADIRIFGMTGGKMNASVIHQVDPSLGKENAGLVRLANGQLGYVADDRRHYEESGKRNPHRAPQSIDYMDAVALMLDPRYSPNMGTIAIGFSNKHIRMMLDDGNIRMVIPYHRSGLPSLYMHLTGLSTVNAEGKSELIVQDYTDTQTASVKELYNRQGKAVNPASLRKGDKKALREAAMSWKFSAHLNENGGDPVKTAKEYLEWCASDHIFVAKDGKEYHFTVKPAFEQFSDHDNYYKVLIDFDPYDPVTGEIAKQGAVRLSYAGDSEATTLNEQQLTEYRERLEATNMFTAEQIDGYMQWAQQDLMDILREELSKEQEYIESTEAQEGPAFEKVSEMLRTKYNRATYDENAVMAEHGIPAEKKSSDTSYRQDTVLHESDFDENRVQKSIRSYDDDYAPTFYSQMEKVVSGMKQDKFGASSVVDMLRGRGVKAEEIKWSGIEAWLEGKKSVTKAELQEFIAGSMLQIEEEQSDPDSLALKYIGNNTYKLYGADGNVLDTFVFNKFMEGYVSENTEEIYSTTYEIEDAVREEYGSQSLPRWSDYKLKGGTNYREIVFRLPNNNYSNKAMKIHWGDDAEGVLAHARIQDFTVNGKKMLFVEELQSDYHNEGHGSGYSDSKTEDRLEALKAVADEKFFAPEDYSTEMTGAAGEWETVEKTVKGARLLLEHREAQTAYDKAMDEFMKQVPDAPFKDTYHEYVMKRLLRMAAEQGYDSIGWTTSETQIERWTDEFEKGFRIEYDQDIPKFLAKYGKKWGATVSKTQNSPNGITIWQMDIPEVMQDSVLYEGQAQYQKRTNTLTDHEILDMAAKELDTSKLTDAEKSALDIFRKRVDKLKALKEERQKQGSIFYEHQFGANKDTAKATAARNRMAVLDNQITKASAEVLGLEDKKVLKDVLQKSRKVIEQKERKESLERIRVAREETRAKERKIANEKLEALRLKKNAQIAEVRAEEREKATDRVKTVRESYQSSRLREKIKAFKAKLEKNLLNPTERQYVPAGLTQAMIDVVNLIDIDTDLVNPDGTVNKAQERRNETKMKLSDLAAEYEKIKASDPVYAGEFDEAVYNYLTELRDNFAGRHLREMTLGELTEMYEILRSIEETLQDARKLIGWGDAETVYEAGDSIIAEQNAITAKRKDGKRTWQQEKRDNSLALTLSPVRYVERMSAYHQNSYLLRMFKAFEKGIRKKNMFKMQAYKSFEVLTSRQQYEDAIYTPVGSIYTDANGRSFRLSKMQMMQAILSLEREQANNMSHIEGSGFSFADLDMLKKGRLKDAISEEHSHRVPNAVDMVGEFIDLLKDDKWAQDYMVAARKFFNETAKDAINETSLALKHRIVAKDKSYIPFEVDKNFIVNEISAANDVQQTINSYGMLKDTKKFASNPLIITGLNNILDRHIEQVGNIYGLAIEIRNFNKVWNVRGLEADSGDPTVKATIQRNWGDKGLKLVEQAVQDIQGPRHNSQSDLYKKIKSGYIGATFLLNLSVVSKQIGSLFSATSMLRWRGPVRQIGNLLYTMTHSKKLSAEVDKYTASAWLRRQGLSDAEVYTLMTEGKRTWLGRLANKAPAMVNPTKWITAMDHTVALSLWKYAKEDTAKRTGLKGETLLQATAEFYDEMIENTQSMTDVLHRPEIQKRSDVISESFGMFKTDLYQMAGQLLVSGERYHANKTKDNRNALVRTAYAVTMSAVWGQLMTTVFALLRYKVDQYRDDEDKDLTAESWMKRQGVALAGDVAGYIFPLLGSEIVGFVENIFTGESDELVDSLGITAINNAYDTIIKVLSPLADGELPKTSDLRKLTTSTLQMFGVPANNILRTLDAIQLHAKDIANGRFMSFEAGIQRSSTHHANRIMETVEKGNMDLANALFEEAVEEAALKKSEDGSISEEALKDARSSLQTAFGKKYKDGEISAEQAEKILVDLFGKSKDDAYWTIKAWDTGDSSKYSAVFDAALSGTGFNEALKEMTDHGYKKDDVLSKLKTQIKAWYTDEESETRITKQQAMDMLKKYVGMSSDEVTSTINQWSSKVVTGIAYDDIKDEFMAGKMTASRAIEMRVRYGSKSKEDATAEVSAWNAEKKYGLSSDIAKAYTKTIKAIGKSLEQAGIKADVFTKYKDLSSKCEGYDKDGDGKTDSGSKKEQIMDVIHSLPLTVAQKDALYYSNSNWSVEAINEAPWHQ